MAKMDEATRKRVRAGRLMPAGKTPAEAAKAVGVARQTAYTWKASAQGRRHRSVARHGNAIPVLRYDLLWDIHRLQDVVRQGTSHIYGRTRLGCRQAVLGTARHARLGTVRRTVLVGAAGCVVDRRRTSTEALVTGPSIAGLIEEPCQDFPAQTARRRKVERLRTLLVLGRTIDYASQHSPP